MKPSIVSAKPLASSLLPPDCVGLQGYSRLGAALHGLGSYDEAIEAYEKGLKIEPENASLKKGLQEVERVLGQCTSP